MRRMIVVVALYAFSPAFGQQQPPVDPQVAVYRQLLDNANSQLAQTIVAMQAQIAQLQKELAAEKAKNAPKDAAKPDLPTAAPSAVPSLVK
jgi:cell division protein FtsB